MRVILEVDRDRCVDRSGGIERTGEDAAPRGVAAAMECRMTDLEGLTARGFGAGSRVGGCSAADGRAEKRQDGAVEQGGHGCVPVPAVHALVRWNPDVVSRYCSCPQRVG